MPYTFTGELYVWESGQPGSWVFVNLPTDVSDAVDDEVVGPRRGFGSVRVEVTVGSTTWRTSLFPSKAAATFVLPVKKAVLKAEELEPGDEVVVGLELVDQPQ